MKHNHRIKTYYERFVSAYNPYAHTLISSFRLVHQISNDMQKDGYTDNEILVQADKARDYWNLPKIERG